MVLTPTYYVFKMYNVHQDATFLPLDLNCEIMDVRDNRKVPMVSATASKDKDGKIHISMSNIDADNSFENPNNIKLAPFKEVKINKGVLKIKLPAKSIVTIELQ